MLDSVNDELGGLVDAKAQPTSPRQSKPAASVGADRGMSDRPLLGDTPHSLERALLSFWSVFRNLVSTKQKAFWISL